MTVDDLRLIGDRILVRPDPKEAVSEGGLVIPETVLADNPNYYYVSGVVVKLGDGWREDVYECSNQQCRYRSRRTAGEYCPICRASQTLYAVGDGRRPFDVKVGDRVHFGRFDGKQVDLTDPMGDLQRVSLHLQMLGLTRFLILREVEIRGVLTDGARVTSGYVPASRGRVTPGLTPV